MERNKLRGFRMALARKFPDDWPAPPDCIWMMWQAEGGDEGAMERTAEEWEVSLGMVRAICRSRSVNRLARRVSAREHRELVGLAREYAKVGAQRAEVHRGA